MRLAIGLGGHALPQCTASDEAWLAVARAIAPLLSEHRVFITHGNGPQVGNLAESESAVGLDQATAATAGWIGYRLERALRSSVPQARVATLLTLALVGSSQPE
jgi:carbamate kinase